jgi:16S rRNA processing protein RimM
MAPKKAQASADNSRRIFLAEIVGVHGVKGAVKLKVFAADPLSIADYGPMMLDASDKTLELSSIQQHGNTYIAFFKELADRTAAERLRGKKLYVARDVLPDITDDKTFYQADLIGLEARWPDGKKMGAIVNVANFGAGDLLEIKPIKGASFYVPFTSAVVPTVALADGFAVIDPPPGLL